MIVAPSPLWSTYPFRTRQGVDPDPDYAAARATGSPVPVRIGTDGWAWLVTSLSQVRTVHTDPRFSRAAAAEHPIASEVGLAPPTGSLLALDGEDHARLRRLVTGAFSARRVERLRPKLRQQALKLLAACPDNGPVDLIAGYARPLSVHMIGDLLGVPTSDHEMFARLSTVVLSTVRGTEEEIGRARGELVSYLRNLLTYKSDTNDQDLLSDLARHRDHASPQELVMLSVAVLVAGHGTTCSGLASSLLLVLSDAPLAKRLRDRPETVGEVVEELLRFISIGAVGGFPRVATTDVEVGGVTVRKGDIVIAALNAANRDPDVFPDPDRIDPNRYHQPTGAPAAAAHMAFGAGPHHCIGAALARMELTEGLSVLLDTRPSARLVHDSTPHWSNSSLIRTLIDLPALLGRAASPQPRAVELARP